MARKPIPPSKRNGGFMLALSLLLSFAVADSRRVMPSMSIIIAICAFGVIITAVVWYWDFRWKEEFYLIGKVAVVYGIAVLGLAGQFFLALGLIILLIVVLIYPPIAKQTHEAV